MAYTGSDYFVKVALAGSTTAYVRDYDLNENLQNKGALLYVSSNANAQGLVQ